MTPSEAATLLNGREYRNEVDDNLRDIFIANRIVVVYGASDDIMIFDGAINDEFYGKTYLDENGLIENECVEDCPHYKKKIKNAKFVSPLILDPWSYETNIQNIFYFHIMEDNNIYCRGMAFSLNDL